MNHFKQLTVKDLKRCLALLPDNMPIRIGFGDKEFPAYFITPSAKKNGGLVLISDLYQEDASLYNEKTVLKLLTLENKED